MPDEINLKDDYRLANCCNPQPGDEIVGFLKFDSPLISIHRADCVNLAKVGTDRLVKLTWAEISRDKIERTITDEPDYQALDEIDFRILAHHYKLGPDYAAVVAKATQVSRADVFEHHKKLRDLNLLIRVQPVMMQYRKGIVKGKWIKHRNHTYYELTDKGREFVEYYFDNIKKGDLK
jgi:(p)ppGpp synthase/HD superfamily hydrolase